MKILQVINSLASGGAEKLLLETLPLYRKKGIEMDVLVLNGTDTSFMKQLKALNCCAVYSLGTASVYNPLLIFKLIPFLKKYSLVHVHLFPAQYWVVMAKLISFSKVKLIFTEHCTSNRRLENKIFKFIDQHCYRFYDGVVAISKEINEIVLKHSKLNISKIHTIENGVNLNTIRKAPSLNKKDILPSFKEEDKLLIQVAGFRAQKDQTTLIKAMQLLPLEVKLVLAGEGVLKKKCQDLVETLNLKERVVFLGLRMDIPQLLKTADVVVLSSKYEGLSLSSIEGMAAGKPFVASDVPGLREVVKGAGILFPMSNVKQLAKEISKLLDSPKHYQFVANACQKRAAKYDIYKMVDQHINIYKSMYEA